jgi:hypothetical protein
MLSFFSRTRMRAAYLYIKKKGGGEASHKDSMITRNDSPEKMIK